jgi:hypothetical protein
MQKMAIVNDYAAIAAELRRLKAERRSQDAVTPEPPNVRPLRGSWHPMRAPTAGETLYRRLVSQRRRANSTARTYRYDEKMCDPLIEAGSAVDQLKISGANLGVDL